MTDPLVLGCIWVLVAAGIAALPRRLHWPGAIALIGTGIPLVGLATWHYGPMAGLIGLAVGASVLRWPLIFLARRVRRGVGGGAE